MYGNLRPVAAIFKSTAIELLSEPFVLLVTLVAAAVGVLAPALHYHQFGDPTRMARDAGVSVTLVASALAAAYSAVHTFRREIESRTLDTALAKAVSRRTFFLAKTAAVFAATAGVAFVTAALALAAVRGAELGGEAAEATGLIARPDRGVFAAALGAAVLPLVVGAALNRFARCRFTLSASLTALALALSLAGYAACTLKAAGVLPLLFLSALPALPLAAAGAAFAVRFKTNFAAALTALAAAALLPALGNYCLTDVLSAGAAIGWSYPLFALLALAPAVAGFLILGVHFIEDREVGDQAA